MPSSTAPGVDGPVRVLLRHADAGLRTAWSGPDEWRGLSRLGQAQATAVAARLAGLPIRRILSSPSLRCRQTVVPLARKLSIDVEPCRELASQVELGSLLRLLRDAQTEAAVLCTHRETLQLLFTHLLRAGVAVGSGIDPMAMAAAWVMRGTPGGVGQIRLDYVPAAGAARAAGVAEASATCHRRGRT
jgi:phosphohistidine phosphatase SixA